MDDYEEPRVKRQKVDKNGRFAALQKLKDLKGKKHKADISEEIDNLYDIVDEKEFAKRTNYGADWIEDDGTGYVEDGRDIFEDDDELSDDNTKSKNSKKKRSRNEKEPVAKGKSSIRNLFSNAVPKKKKETVVKLAEDDVLADILDEIDGENKPKDDNSGNTADKKLLNSKSEEIIVKEYMENFMNSIKSKKIASTKKDEESDDEMLDRIMKPDKQENKNKTELIQTTTIDNSRKNSSKLNKTHDKLEKSNKTNAENVEIILESKDSSKKNIASGIRSSSSEIVDDTDYNALINDDENDFVENIRDLDIESESSKPTVEEKKISPEEDMKNLLNNWENICQMDNFDEEINNGISKGDEQKLSSEILKFWYWDAWEDTLKRPGDVFLFGKINNGGINGLKSICVHVENVERILYLLPREYLLDPITKEVTKQKVALIDVYKEFENNIARSLGIQTFKSEKVTKNFAFHVAGIDVPESCEYIEIRYEGKKPAPDPKKIYNSIAYIFGTNTSFLETFLLEHKIKGPGWLAIKNFYINENPLSWCKLEATCSSTNIQLAEDQRNDPPPPLIVMSINIRSTLNLKNNKNEIVMISCLVNNRFYADKPPPIPPFNRHFCGFTRPYTQNWPLDLQQNLAQYKSTKTTKLDSERALLSWFLAIYQNIDADLIVTHDAADLQLDLICDRILANKIHMWSRLSRLRMVQSFGKKMKDFFVGRLICDVKQSAEELIKSKSYDLDTLCQTVLKLKQNERADISNEDLLQMYETSAGLLKLITLTMQDCSYILRLMCEMNVMPLALQITNICGNLISRTLQGGRSERNEFLLLHAFHERNYIVPDKKKKTWSENQQVMLDGEDASNTTQGSRKKASYSGGLVLEPIKGFYDKYILLMDFNSLYPSIIQEFNICFTTVPEPESSDDMPPLPDSSVEQGILPRQIRRLVESRREVKKLMAVPDLNSDLKMQYNIRQLALKLTANSMYGCLGFAQSRFFAQHLASLVTAKGREILMNTKNLVQKANYEVIYGDTDSIMVNTNSTDYEQVYKIGYTIKTMINKIYRQIELDIDGVFKSLLLLKKKKYAALIVKKNQRGEISYDQEHKGLDIVRRDWSQITVMAGKLVLNEILSDLPLEEKIDNIHAHLEKFKQNILDGSVPLPLLTIAKQLTKQPKEYTNINLPHVNVAKRMNETRNKRYKKGDMVNYVICDDGTDNAAMQRAYHIDELKMNEKLKVDTQYYLAQQIHPVVFRLCEPLEGTDASRIAQCLGLDASKFRAAAAKSQRDKLDEGGVGQSITKSNLQKYRQCEKFNFTCISCNKQNIVASALKPHEKGYISILQNCSNSECTAAPYQYIQSIRNEMILSIRSFIKRFYNNWMICDEPTCNVNTRIFSHVLINNRPVCMTCKNGTLIRSYSERDLYHQISYYQYIFDLSQHDQKNITLSLEIEMAYKTIKDTIDELLDKSAYCSINLNSIFGSTKPSNKTELIVSDV